MKFIVLTYDDRFPFVELMVKSYKRFFPNANFEFVIPYNSDSIKVKIEKLSATTIPIKSEKEIKTTMSNLLEGIPDDEFVYWCGDDRYMENIVVPNTTIFKRLYNILSKSEIKVDAVRILTTQKYITHKKIDLKGFSIYKDNTHVVHGFWNHHFIRSKYLENIFVNNILPENYSLQDLHRYLEKNNKKYVHRIFTVPKSLCLLGETTYRNKIVINCKKAMRQYMIKVPKNVSISKKSIYFNGRPIIK